MPRVSIIMPVHNGEKTLRRSLQSLADQTYRDFETVFVNNNCTDSSLDIAKEFKEAANIRVVDCAPKGIVCALNCGIQNSQSEFVARQDADDYWHPTKLQKQIDFMEENEDVGVVGTLLQLVNEQGENQEIGTFGNPVKYPTQDFQIKWLLCSGQNPFCHPSVLIRRYLFYKVGGYTDRFHLAEDMELWFKMLPYTKFSNIDEVLIDYTQTHREDYDPNIVVYMSNLYFNMYKDFGWVDGDKPEVLFDWQVNGRSKNV